MPPRAKGNTKSSILSHIKVLGPAQTVTLTYDEVENEATTPGVVKRRPGRPRKDESATKAPAVPAGNKRGRDEDSVTSAPSKKGGAASSSSATHKGGAAQATSSSRGGGSAGEDKDNEASSKNKARYPDIAFKFTGTGSGKSSKSHTDILTAVVADICKAERVGLEKFFKANPGPGRDDILAVLKQVLADLPTEIASKCPADAEFEPEFGRGERGEVEMLTSVLSTLKEQSDALARYEQNIGLLGNDQGLWITSDHVPKSSGAAGGSSPTKRGQGDTINIEKNAESFGKLLDSMEAHCRAIIKDSGKITQVIDDATRMQDRVYESYNRVRHEAPVVIGGAAVAVGVPASINPKDLVKSLARK